MYDVYEITSLHAEMVDRWHNEPIYNSCTGFLHAVCEQHACNFRLWHHEDLARSPDADDSTIANVKRAIDRENQMRNDRIEVLDHLILAELARRQIDLAVDAPLNTETPGSTIDRLSILALRIYHLGEELRRPGASEEHRAKVAKRLAICHEQHEDLSGALGELFDDLGAGRKRMKLYRQFKMYNDPTLNPYLYQAKRKRGEILPAPAAAAR
jgi:hypothetical protein